MDVDLTFFERYGLKMDVKTTLCTHWIPLNNFELLFTYQLKSTYLPQQGNASGARCLAYDRLCPQEPHRSSNHVLYDKKEEVLKKRETRQFKCIQTWPNGIAVSSFRNTIELEYLCFDFQYW